MRCAFFFFLPSSFSSFGFRRRFLTCAPRIGHATLSARRLAAAVAALRRGRGGVLHLRVRNVAADADAEAVTDAVVARVRAAAAAAGVRWAVRAGSPGGALRLSAPADTLVVDVICEGAPAPLHHPTPSLAAAAAPTLPVRPPAAPLRRVHCPDAAAFARHVASSRQPLILTGAPLGACVTKWSAAYLAAAAPAGATASVHVSEGRTIDLAGHRPRGTRRNFSFKTVPFAEAVRRCAAAGDGDEAALPPLLAPGERLYLRSVGGACCVCCVVVAVRVRASSHHSSHARTQLR
jgi:hypothetical protein